MYFKYIGINGIIQINLVNRRTMHVMKLEKKLHNVRNIPQVKIDGIYLQKQDFFNCNLNGILSAFFYQLTRLKLMVSTTK